MKKFCFIIFVVSLFLSSCTQKPSYQIPKYDPNQKSKTVISENNINTQVLVSFRNDISHSEACCWLKEHDAKILDANEQFNYYLVRTHSEKAAEALISQCETPIVDCAVRNMFLDPCAVKMHAIDNFITPTSNESILTHGEMVKEIMENETDNIYVSAHNVKFGNNISMDSITSKFLDICEQMNDTDMTIVNFSLGVSKYEDEEQTKLKPQEIFYKDYANEVRWYANLAHKCGNKNFIITKAMGNDSKHSIDEAFQLSLEKMNDNQRKALKEHMIIVAAKDTRKEFLQGYSNTINHKIEGVNTIMVDISDKPLHQSGTSAAAPLVANWIAKSGFTNASDVITTVNKSTQDDELVSEYAFSRIAQNVLQSDKKQYDHQSFKIANEYENLESERSNETYYSNDLVGTKWMHINKYGQLSCILTFFSENKVRIKNFIRYSNSSNAPIHVQEIDNTYTYDQSNKRGIQYATNGDFMYFVFSNNSLIFTGEYNDGRPARMVFVPYSEKRKSEGITISNGYVDLGLPSGTLWKNTNEKGDFTHEQAMAKFGNSLPTKEQFEELISSCKWTWTGRGYKVTGPSSKSIYLPAEGWGMPASEVYDKETDGLYWSSTSYGYDNAYCLYFISNDFDLNKSSQDYSFSVRLVTVLQN